MMRDRIHGLVLFLVALLPACRNLVTIPELDEGLRREHTQTVILAPRYSLYSPYDVDATAEFVEIVDRELPRVFDLFELEDDEPVFIWMQPVLEGPLEVRAGETLPASTIPKSGVLGSAHGTETILIAVAPVRRVHFDEGPLEFRVRDMSIDSTIRHELAHVATHRLHLGPLPSWFREGVAETVEAYVPGEDRLIPHVAEEILRAAAAVPREQRSLARVLDWEQRLPIAPDDVTLRVLACALVTFLLEDSDSLPDSLRRIASMPRSELLVLEEEWQSWLDDR